VCGGDSPADKQADKQIDRQNKMAEYQHEGDETIDAGVRGSFGVTKDKVYIAA
jgi:hypothetical protein